MMYAELHEYLLLHKKLPLPGLGAFIIQRHPAQGDFPNKLIGGPGYSIQWKEGQEGSSDGIWEWVAAGSSISMHDARHRLEKFIYQLKAGVASGDIIHWKGVGTLQKGLGGGIKFVPEREMIREAPVKANKVIRERAEHMVRVGEDERTSEQMTEMLGSKEKKKLMGWWIAAGIAGLLSIGFLVWHLSEHDWKLNTGNQQTLEINKVPTTTYQQIQ
jgi:hypothetical protein